MKSVAQTIEVSRSQLHAKAAGRPKPRGCYRKAGDDERPTEVLPDPWTGSGGF